MFRLVIPVLMWSPELLEKYKIQDSDAVFAEGEEEDMILYSVASIRRTTEDGVEYTFIDNCGGQTFVTKLSLEEVDKLIFQAYLEASTTYYIKN